MGGSRLAALSSLPRVRLPLISVALQISVDVAAVNFETRKAHDSYTLMRIWIIFRGTAADPF